MPSSIPTWPTPSVQSSRHLQPRHRQSRTIVRPVPLRIIEVALPGYMMAIPRPNPAANVAASVMITQARAVLGFRSTNPAARANQRG